MGHIRRSKESPKVSISSRFLLDPFRQGRVLAAGPALKAGMVERIESLSDVVARLQTPQGRRAVMDARAAAPVETTAQEPSPATAQESDTLREALLKLELESL